MTYKMSTRRKLAIATWSSPREGNIYGKMTIDMTNALAYIQHVRESTGDKVTITHLVGKAVGLAMAQAPDLNGRIVFGRYIPHETVDIAFLVAFEGGTDLGKVKVSNIDKKNLREIADELSGRSRKLRTGKDDEFERSKPMLKAMPTFLLRPIVSLIGYVTGALGLDVPALGLKAFPFGGCIITSVGMLGVDEGYAPPTPFARVPVYILVTKVKDRAVVHNGEVVVRPELDLMATVDHRFLDGYQGAVLVKVIRQSLEEPWRLDGLTQSPIQEYKRLNIGCAAEKV